VPFAYFQISEYERGVADVDSCATKKLLHIKLKRLKIEKKVLSLWSLDWWEEETRSYVGSGDCNE